MKETYKCIFDRDHLQNIGPMIPLKVCISDKFAEALLASGRPIPHPIEGVGLIDTGAAHSSVDETIIKSLGAESIGVREYGGAAGRYNHATYSVTFVFPGELAFKFADMGSVQLAENNRPGVTPLIGLIGRDIPSLCVFVYNGKTGQYKLTMTEPDDEELKIDSASSPV